ncbi:MAG: hypothetical protein FWF45_02405 [Coriobacteriia bacterium]|nr:hypothetical protein [Coriobacteriia bacterium]
MLDTLALVSSNPLCPLDLSRAAQDTLARAVQTFATGEECLKALAYQEQGDSCVVLVDDTISDLAPLNLIDALRREHPKISSILMADDLNPEMVSRAMLAGARATLPTGASELDLAEVLRLLARASQAAAGKGGSEISADASAQRGTIAVVFGARGGAGKSTLSALLALLAAQADLDVALVDFDIQFGDMGFLFGSDPGYTLIDLAVALEQGNRQSRNFSEQVEAGVNLYAPMPSSQQADDIAGQARRLLNAIAAEHELVIVNTGAFQALLHAELLDTADVAVCVLDQTLVGAWATHRLREICVGLGIPPVRLRYVVDRARSGGGYRPSIDEISTILEGVALRTIDDGGLKLSQILDAGDFGALIQKSRGAFAAQISLILDDIALATGLDLNSLPHMRSALRREAKGRLRK